jgi:two-component system LytT family sensor kinase
LEISLSANTKIGDESGLKTGRRDSLLKWGLIFGFWNALGFLYSTQVYFENSNETRNISFWLLFCWQLFGYWYGWFLFTPCILWLGTKFPLERNSWQKNGLIHTAFLIILLITHSFWYVLLGIVTNPYHIQQKYDEVGGYLQYRITHQFYIELMFYVMILGVGNAFDYYRRFREREFRATQLESQLAVSQLQVLKMQLHPHFLFNTLNAITALVRGQNNKAAVKMLVGLSDLLRYTLQSADQQEVPLSEEIEFLKLYLDLQQMRFSDRLEVEMHIDPNSLEINVPNLILQPLVENSIRHGLSQQVSAGFIRIKTRCANGKLQVKIYDNGRGLPENWILENNEGIGLANIRERLRQLYGDDYRFDLRNQKSGGVEATLEIPGAPFAKEL